MSVRLLISCRWLTAIIVAFNLLGMMAGTALAENPENKLGNWIGFNSTIRFSDHWSAFGQGELRTWEMASNLEELLWRIAVHYDITPEAMVGFGYVRSDRWPFDDVYDRGRKRYENRVYQEFALKQAWASSQFQHRFRLEQRWLTAAGEAEYSNRIRYRLQVTIPLNYASIQPGAYFLNASNETFINFASGERSFDQNRLYGGVGYQFTPSQNLQVGLLWQARASTDFLRLGIFYTINFDLRKR